MYYYYKIENDINHNIYIGITTDPIKRKNRHFNLLQQNKHFNPHLQASVNKYGIKHFSFDVIEAIDYQDVKMAYNHEAELIKIYDSNNTGYNCNPGGQWTGPKGLFNENDIYYIKSACYFDSGVTGILGEIYNCSPSTINNIRIGDNYKIWCEQFDKMSEQEKYNYYEDFCSITNYPILKNGKCKSARKLNREQVFIILLNDEYKFTKFSILRRKFGFADDHRYTFMDIRKGKTYKEFYYEYHNFTQDQKQKMLCLYTEMYK